MSEALFNEMHMSKLISMRSIAAIMATTLFASDFLEAASNDKRPARNSGTLSVISNVVQTRDSNKKVCFGFTTEGKIFKITDGKYACITGQRINQVPQPAPGTFTEIIKQPSVGMIDLPKLARITPGVTGNLISLNPQEIAIPALETGIGPTTYLHTDDSNNHYFSSADPYGNIIISMMNYVLTAGQVGVIDDSRAAVLPFRQVGSSPLPSKSTPSQPSTQPVSQHCIKWPLLCR